MPALQPSPAPGAAPGAAPPGAPPTPAPPGGTGQAVVPQGMAGKRQAAMTSLKIGLTAFNSALQGLEMGSDLHEAVMKAIAGISKKLKQGDEPSPASQMQELTNMAKTAQLDPKKAALARAFPQQAPPGDGGGAPPLDQAA